MNEEIIIQMVTPYLDNGKLTYENFDEIFNMLSKKEQYQVTEILYKNSIELTDSEDDKTDEIEEYDDADEKIEFEILYDDSIFKDSDSYLIKNELSYRTEINHTNEELCRLIRSGDRQAKQDICIKNQRLVKKFAWGYRWFCKNGIELSDLEQEGYIGLLIAAEKFDPFYGTEFSTYAVPWIRQRITRYIHDAGNTVRLPVHLHERIHKIEKLDKYYSMLEYDFDDRVTFIARDTSLSKERVIELFTIRNTFYQLASLDVPVGEDESTLLGEFIPDKYYDLELEVENKALTEAIEDVLLTLKPREADIIKLRFGLYDGAPMTLEEVGKQYGVTRERIRQIESKALRKLRHPSRLKYYKDFRRK